MPFDFAPSDDLSLRGLVAYHDGLAAENSVESHYQTVGFEIVERRWRGQAGEIDLILKDGAGFIFVEVKKAKTHAAAAESLSMRQLGRICRTGEEYVAKVCPDRPVCMRFDLAMVDGQGRIDILENISQY